MSKYNISVELLFGFLDEDVRNIVYTCSCRGKVLLDYIIIQLISIPGADGIHFPFSFQGQGMISIIHLAKNVNSAELGWYGDVILDACLQNIASSDEIWEYVVEMSVLLATSTQQSNPRSSW